jgi:hypothetical protein
LVRWIEVQSGYVRDGNHFYQNSIDLDKINLEKCNQHIIDVERVIEGKKKFASRVKRAISSSSPVDKITFIQDILSGCINHTDAIRAIIASVSVASEKAEIIKILIDITESPNKKVELIKDIVAYSQTLEDRNNAIKTILTHSHTLVEKASAIQAIVTNSKAELIEYESRMIKSLIFSNIEYRDLNMSHLDVLTECQSLKFQDFHDKHKAYMADIEAKFDADKVSIIQAIVDTSLTSDEKADLICCSVYICNDSIPTAIIDTKEFLKIIRKWGSSQNAEYMHDMDYSTLKELLKSYFDMPLEEPPKKRTRCSSI